MAILEDVEWGGDFVTGLALIAIAIALVAVGVLSGRWRSGFWRAGPPKLRVARFDQSSDEFGVL